jgi:uncharacterized protein YbaR (Trm112 family)/SAM-dependent methyltransferase
MRYSLLDQLACPACLAPLICITEREIASVMPVGRSSGGTRVSAGPGVGPAPAWQTANDVTRALDEHAGAAAQGSRGDAVEVESGLLVCGCGRWFPIERSIPELLPDHLRSPERDAAFFDALVPQLPERLRRALQESQPGSEHSDADAGAHHKRAEIGITSKVADKAFFAPGYSSPFAYWDSDFSVYLLKLFGTVAPLLRLRRGERVLDSGCGYAWTTEWLFRSGFDPIGVDICRTYLEVGIERMGVPRPHLVIGDVETLPLGRNAATAVLAYESFHHIPNRPRAMQAYERILADQGIVILAEPGAAHEHAPVAIDAMEKYGILEKGMELADVRGYCEGTSLHAEQVFVVRLADAEIGAAFDQGFVGSHSTVEGNLFRIVKGGRPAPAAERQEPQRGLLARVKRRVRAALQA